MPVPDSLDKKREEDDIFYLTEDSIFSLFLSNDTHCPKAVLISEKLHFISVKI
jgi:hypothetical protein